MTDALSLNVVFIKHKDARLDLKKGRREHTPQPQFRATESDFSANGNVTI